MKRKKSSKKILLVLVCVVCITVFFILITKESGQADVDNSIMQNDVENTNNENNEKVNNNIKDNLINENVSQSSSVSNEDKQTPENVNYIQMSNDNKICSAYILGKFDNGKALSTEQYLKVVYNALNNGYISLNKTNYTEEEINSIVYSIFNVKLSEHKSVDGLTYTKGIYTFRKNESKKIELNNVQKDVAAGNIFVEFEVNEMNYIAKLRTNTLTGETYVTSIVGE